jgi:hypothetical protein
MLFSSSNWKLETKIAGWHICSTAICKGISMTTNPNKFCQIVAVMLVLFCMSGCYVVSKNPLPVKSAPDRELLGTWREAGDKKDSTSSSSYMVFAEDQDGWLQVMIMENSFDKGEIYRGICSEIAGEKYLNLKKVNFGKGVQRPELDENYTLVHYRVANNKRLELATLNDPIFKQAVKSHELAGILSSDGDDLTLTCTSEELADFLRQHKPEEFLDEPDLMEKTNPLPEAVKP